MNRHFLILLLCSFCIIKCTDNSETIEGEEIQEFPSITYDCPSSNFIHVLDTFTANIQVKGMLSPLKSFRIYSKQKEFAEVSTFKNAFEFNYQLEHIPGMDERFTGYYIFFEALNQHGNITKDSIWLEVSPILFQTYYRDSETQIKIDSIIYVNTLNSMDIEFIAHGGLKSFKFRKINLYDTINVLSVSNFPANQKVLNYSYSQNPDVNEYYHQFIIEDNYGNSELKTLIVSKPLEYTFNDAEVHSCSEESTYGWNLIENNGSTYSQDNYHIYYSNSSNELNSTSGYGFITSDNMNLVGVPYGMIDFEEMRSHDLEIIFHGNAKTNKVAEYQFNYIIIQLQNKRDYVLLKHIGGRFGGGSKCSNGFESIRFDYKKVSQNSGI